MQTPNRESSRQSWGIAVDLGARGYVCAGEAVLARAATIRDADAAAVRSLCASTQASWIRQSGRHAAAKAFDGAAVRSAFAAVDARPEPLAVAALGDALTGLAADNLGIGRFDVTRRLLDRVADEVVPALDASADFVCGARVELRWRWVSTELALYSGDARGAARAAALGVESAESAPSPRHRIKTDLIAAAAAAVNADSTTAQRLAESSAQRCADADLLPLCWAALTMLTGLLPGDRRAEPAAELTGVVDELARRGMRM